MKRQSKKKHDDFIKELQKPVYASKRAAILLKNSVWTNASPLEMELLADLELKMDDIFGASEDE